VPILYGLTVLTAPSTYKMRIYSTIML